MGSSTRPVGGWLWSFGVTIAALTALAGSYSLSVNHPWWSNALTGTGVTLFLLVPGAWLTTKILSSLKQTKQASDQAAQGAEAALRTAVDAKNIAAQTATSLEDVRSALMKSQLQEHDEHLGVYRRVLHDHSRSALLAALRRAVTEEIASSRCILSRVWETGLYYRVTVDVEDDLLEMQLETLAGLVYARHVWEPDIPPEDFYSRLARSVRDAGADLGVKLNDPTESIQHLVTMFENVAELRAQALMGYRHTLRNIITMDEFDEGEGWYFTETAAIPQRDPHYEVRYDRLDELDWVEHMRGKRFHMAKLAIDQARILAQRLSLPDESENIV